MSEPMIESNKENIPPSVSIPLEEGEKVTHMSLQEYANRLAQELFRVKAIVSQVPIDEISSRLEEIKISIAMYRRLFDILVTEQTRRFNVDSSSSMKEILEVEDMTID